MISSPHWFTLHTAALCKAGIGRIQGLGTSIQVLPMHDRSLNTCAFSVDGSVMEHFRLESEFFYRMLDLKQEANSIAPQCQFLLKVILILTLPGVLYTVCYLTI